METAGLQTESLKSAEIPMFSIVLRHFIKCLTQILTQNKKFAYGDIESKYFLSFFTFDNFAIQRLTLYI